jgi:hypothetical protein
VPNWLSVGSSYRAPLVTINTETESKPLFIEEQNISENATSSSIFSSQENSTLFSEGKDFSLDMVSRDKKARGKKERKNENDYASDIEMLGKKRKKEKKKEEKKEKKEKKDKNRNKTEDNKKPEKEISKNKKDKEKGKESTISHHGNNNDNNDNNENQYLPDSDDSEDSWSTDGDNNTNFKKMKSNQLVNIGHNHDIEKNAKNIIFLPDGKILVTAKSGSELGSKVPGVDWVTDTRGDSSIKAHGYYLPDIPVYKLYTGSIAENHGNSNFENNNINNNNYSTNSNVRFSTARANSKFTSSFSLALKNHNLPSGAIFASKNSAIFRPQEKTILQQKYGKSEILREIRLKKRNRFFIAGKYELGNDGETNSKKTKKLSTDVISDISVKRIRFDILRKRKQQQIEKQKFIIQNDRSNDIQNSSQNDYPFYPEKSFLNSSFLPLPAHTISGMEKEFENENKEITVKTQENKPNRAAFFGFGSTENITNIKENSSKDTVLKNNKTEIEVKKIEKVFLSDAEVKHFFMIFYFLLFYFILWNFIHFFFNILLLHFIFFIPHFLQYFVFFIL